MFGFLQNLLFKREKESRLEGESFQSERMRELREGETERSERNKEE